MLRITAGSAGESRNHAKDLTNFCEDWHKELLKPQNKDEIKSWRSEMIADAKLVGCHRVPLLRSLVVVEVRD